MNKQDRTRVQEELKLNSVQDELAEAEREYKKMTNLADTIIGEINRICVSDKLAEIDVMSYYARENIKKLSYMRYKELVGVDYDEIRK